MKRKSTLILVAALVLAVTIPVFAFAAGNGYNADSTTRTFGRNTSSAAAQGTQLMIQDCDLTEDCDCIAEGTGLGADGEALHQNARVEDGQYLNLGYGSSAQVFGRMGRSASQTFVNCPWTE